MSMPTSRRITPSDHRGRPITLFIDGQAATAYEGETIAAALLAEERPVFRHTAKEDAARGLFCGMGVCYDCLVTVNGRNNVRACQTPVAEGMLVITEKTRQAWRTSAGEQASPARNERDGWTEAAVVGAGPAGLEAALAAAEAGLRVTLVDSAAQIGGQFFKRPPHVSLAAKPEARSLFARFKTASTLQLLTQTLVWGAFPEEDGWLLALHGPNAPYRLHAQWLILAPGAYDRPIAFPGWTLPGVMTAGAVQTLLKSQGVLPGQRFLLAGSGPLQWLVAAQLAKAGAEVAAVLEAVPPSRLLKLQQAPALWGQWQRLKEGWSAWRTLRQAHIPLRFGWAMTRARGQQQVEAVDIAPLDETWRPLSDDTETIAADTLVLGYGFLPSNHLTRLLGCEHDFVARRGGWIPRRDHWMRTSLPGVFAVGDGAGVGGAALARIEGRMAGLRAAHDAGRLSASALAEATHPLRARLRREQRFAALLGELFTPGPGLYALADDETLICRCEEVRLHDIRHAQAAGASSLNEIKGMTRLGMGNCQGRICNQLLTRALVAGVPTQEQEQRLHELGMLSVRPPIFPMSLSDLAAADEDAVANTSYAKQRR